MSSNVNIPKLPAKNKSELTEQVFQAIVDSGETGIFQTELCKSFSIDSRDGSRLVGNLEKQHRFCGAAEEPGESAGA